MSVAARALDNRRLLVRLTIAAIVMFGFGFLLVPFYKTICEISGVNRLLSADTPAANTQVDVTRLVAMEFDANAHAVPWRFTPERASLDIHPGALVRVNYVLENTTDRAIVGQAVPSYGPRFAAQYVKKLDCFCFRQQKLAPRERRVMPVVFVVDPSLPADVKTVTLSYTFFEIEGATRAANEDGARG
ncbi:cytochrome c oxidase assembly protein [Niveibacterium umoris]|uniref:Cytochrome c oxidase assembly protein CtaG n=1 Tax=Niveibacterium umoris TaxID=1193620 RepID=A0A840BMZ2_9RHOO|nr:cytochrome c oxidase assembly protein [Niveibacterium umoris]MBB4013032.1 cytochrome c oxidase assembly protein subunit 11 [Niveibacterium umoris]